jgi:DNA-binding winged helix-turn-helix (wHTH) protein
MQVRFGEFVLDRGTRQLLRNGQEHHIGPKAFELLELLLGHRPNVVAKERIKGRLWPDTYVSGSTLATVVSELRSALHEDPREPRFLRTVHAVGYAFCGEATESGGPPRSAGPGVTAAYRLVLEDHEVALRQGENLLGRVEDGAVWLESPTVSRRHARILVEGEEAVLEDLASKNGTFLRGQRIAAPTRLRDGDVIRLGGVSMTLRALGANQATRTDGGG